MSLGHDRHRSEFSRLCRIPSHLSITLNTFWLIQSQPGIAFVLQRLINARDTFTTSHIVKEQPGVTPVGNSQRQTLRHSPEFLSLTTTPRYWWRMTGSNRRPPACKAGALPAELIPRWLRHAALLKVLHSAAMRQPFAPCLTHPHALRRLA